MIYMYEIVKELKNKLKNVGKLSNKIPLTTYKL